MDTAQWSRAEEAAWLLTRRRLGWDALDLERVDEEGPDSPESHHERLAVWMPAARLLGLALWRAAQDAECAVDDVPLEQVLRWLDGTRELFTRPLPRWKGLPGTWGQLESSAPGLLQKARWITSQHILAHEQEYKEIGEVYDAAPVLLGDRVRAVITGPYRDGRAPRWADLVEYAEETTADACHAARDGRWCPGPAIREAAAQLRPTLDAHPDVPPAPPETAGFLWIQRIARIAHIRATITAVVTHHRDSGNVELHPHPQYPAGHALAASLVALTGFARPAAELEVLWERRTESTATWERAHVPPTMRSYVLALESLVVSLSILTDVILASDCPR
ncbi:hypothetical protein [Streptomyces mobaraensis]|uniref:Uncharacterized protein n=1 Tax=Streptomyces mobaraensis TaxID=35621 RepID=A0A5N5W1K0_STRMB|nr:hypothetical protein [Streptomyces mobaraensis]KAB7835749.1 hypothetical protein FRZ00_26380 [Streptomyces mobaraensis]